MTITVECQCGKSYTTPDEWKGKQFRCKACGGTVQVPDQSQYGGFESPLPPGGPPFIDTSPRRNTAPPPFQSKTNTGSGGTSNMNTAMIHCPACGNMMSNQAYACPKCGNPNPYLTHSNQHGGQDVKEWLPTLLLCIFTGGLGIHRFYTGHTIIGLIQLLTLGGCGVWTLVDLILIVTDSYRDSDGRRLVKR